MIVNGPKPAPGSRHERNRRHQHRRHGVVETAKPSTNQPHVVIQGQPADENVIGSGGNPLAHRADVGEQVGVGKNHAFWLPRATRRVLQQRHIIGAYRHRGIRPGAGQQRLRGDDGPQPLHMALEQSADGLGFRNGDQRSGTGVSEYLGVPAQMIFELGRADRWVYGHRNPASQQNAEEGFEIFPAGGQHDRDGLGGFQALAHQARRQRLRTCLQVCISYAARRFGVGLVQQNVGALGLVLRAPGQHADQWGQVCGHRVGRSRLCLLELDR